MQNIMTTQLPIKPIQDTWEIRGDIAAWYINFQLDFASLSIQEVNAWYLTAFTKILKSFTLFGRVWQVSFKSNAESKTTETTLKWELEVEYNDYIQEITESIQNFPDSIEQLEINLDLSVFVRTKESPDKPVRAWVRNLAHLAICGGKESEKYAKPVVYLDIDHTLFCPSSMYEIDNSELYHLNKSFLEKALRNWEQHFGTINEFDGLEGVYEYGFLPDD